MGDGHPYSHNSAILGGEGDFHRTGPLGRFSLVVAMSIYIYIYMGQKDQDGYYAE